MMAKISSRVHYAWVILLSCCMMVGATLGVIINCNGIFISAVCSELGCTTSSFTFYMTLYGLSSTVVLLKVDSVFERFNIRLVFTAALTVMCLATALMGMANGLAVFYTAGVLQGIAGAFLVFVPAPMLIKNWFASRRGFALGLSAASSGIAGAVMNPVLNEVIRAWGWRAGYFSQAAIAFAIALPFTALFMVKSPEEVGMTPYGGGEQKAAAPKTASSGEGSYWSTGFVLCIIFMTMASLGTSYVQQLSNHAASVGLDSRVGALMLSLAMISNMCGKTLLGAVTDYFGISKTCAVATLMVIAGFLTLSAATSPVLSCVGAFLVGLCYFNQTIIPPLIVAEMVSKDAFDRAYPKVTMASMLSIAFGPTLIAGFFDALGSYSLVFVLGAVFQAASFALAMATLYISRKRR